MVDGNDDPICNASIETMKLTLVVSMDVSKPDFK